MLLIWSWLSSYSGVHELSTDFWSNLWMRRDPNDVQQGVFLIRRQISGISADGHENHVDMQSNKDHGPLNEGEQRLVPQHWQFFRVTASASLICVR